MDEDLIREFLNKRNVFAVVGASRDSEKYGHQVYKDLKSAGYAVYPLNTKAEEILGDRCYADIKKLPRKPDVVDLVIPPKVTEKILDTCLKLGIIRCGCNQAQNLRRRSNSVKTTESRLCMEICVMVQRRRSVA